MQKIKELISKLNLKGKITAQHAKEIEEIIREDQKEAERKGAEEMLRIISKDMGWEESEVFYREMYKKL